MKNNMTHINFSKIQIATSGFMNLKIEIFSTAFFDKDNIAKALERFT